MAFGVQVGVLAGVAVLMTVGVYGAVAAIVKLDDAGLYLLGRPGNAAFAGVQRALGASIVRAAPSLMKGLSIAGTAAMFLVGGGILTHGIAPAHESIRELALACAAIPAVGGFAQVLVPMLLDAGGGVVAGAIVLAAVALVGRAIASLRPGRVAQETRE